jgi:3-hydroxyacyl-CoA dehydrogenase
MRIAGIVGAGLIGRSWAQVFRRAGWEVAAWDPDAKQRDAARALEGVRVVETLEDAVRGAEYVQECGPEVLEVKRETFARLDAAAAPNTVLASSTSALVPSKFTGDLAGRARCVVAHPVNPPHLIPVVEVCGAPWTSPETKRRAIEILKSVGQVPIDVKREIDGFILNRLQVALLTEAFRLVEEGYVSPEDLDHTVADGLGLRWSFMGPFETIELNAPGGIPDYCARYVDWFRRYLADPPQPSVWDDASWAKAVAAWGRSPTPARIAEKSLWRDERLAALVAHKRSQEPHEPK